MKALRSARGQVTKPFCTICPVPTMPVQTFRDLAPDCLLAACGLVAAVLWLERVAESAIAVRLCLFLAISVGDARDA